MKYLILSSILSGFLFVSNTPTTGDFPDFDKKISKLVKKQWKDLEVNCKEADLGENLRSAFRGRKVMQISSNDSLLGFLVVNKAFGCHENGCNGTGFDKNRVIDNSYETFYYAIVFNLDLTIQRVKILQYESDFGYEICGRRWLKQFEGFKGCDLRYGKDVHGITGATISAESITFDINNLCWIMSDLKDELLIEQ